MVTTHDPYSLVKNQQFADWISTNYVEMSKNFHWVQTNRCQLEFKWHASKKKGKGGSYSKKFKYSHDFSVNSDKSHPLEKWKDQVFRIWLWNCNKKGHSLYRSSCSADSLRLKNGMKSNIFAIISVTTNDHPCIQLKRINKMGIAVLPCSSIPAPAATPTNCHSSWIYYQVE